MSAEQERVNDEGHPNKYYHAMLNMADDDLGPYEYRLLGHYRRVCGLTGKCTQSVREIAKACRMSTGKVSETRTKLAKGGWISAIRIQEKGADVGYIVTVIDRMKENVERYAEKALALRNANTPVHEVNTPVRNVNTGVQDVKQRSNKSSKQQKNQSPKEKEIDPFAAAKVALIDVWSRAIHNIDQSVYGNKPMRKQAQSMIDAGVTPTLLEDFLTELMRDGFWRKNPPTFAKTLQKIGAWMASRQPHIVEAEDAAPVHTPSTIAPDTKVIGDMTAAEFDALTDAERQAQIDLKLASIAGRIVGTEGGRRGREAARNELDELNKSA
jgi:DNA-binding Lrp family transcriptional regulator